MSLEDALALVNHTNVNKSLANDIFSGKIVERKGSHLWMEEHKLILFNYKIESFDSSTNEYTIA
ncbi:Hypothetical protein FKW44_017898 [Caligus rogercresseyi]|uniref:Uncharacterized protein n=1 Tax=Caligus rogercresseyi TaxID=217165 RepID=A0A7T8GU17_CALRO|nr:Hypothetical protein FKW44_017898 [Caligus rogercresseyi]